MEDSSNPGSAAMAIARLGARRIALVVATMFAAIALIASLAVAPQPGQGADAATEGDTSELMAGPSWSFTVYGDDDTKPESPWGGGYFGPSWS